MNTYRLIYSYYVMNDITELHQFHMNLLKEYINIFDSVDFYLLCDNPNDDININKNIEYINSILNRDDINFRIIQNESDLREGKIYKTYIIDKLNDYNELIFFAHTKGVTNSVNLENMYNTKLWIAIMYYMNLNFYKNASEDFLNDKILSWGAIYNYDNNNTTKNHWQYTGSFQWINTRALFNYIKCNNIDLSIYENRRKIYTCAEEFLSDMFDPKYAGFLNHKKYNKYFSHFLYENSTLPYFNISWVGFELVDVDTYDLFWDFYNNFN